MSNLSFAEYLWIDGIGPAQQLRSKSRVLSVPDDPVVIDFPMWSLDGFQAGQADSGFACVLNPVRVYRDPFRGANDYIVFCEFGDSSKENHLFNTRVRMRKILDCLGGALDPWLDFEQEYTLFRDGSRLGHPEGGGGTSGTDASRCCGVGSENVCGRALAEAHAKACADAGVLIYGTNAVMPGQWAFSIRYRNIGGDRCDALTLADDVWVARYLLGRLGEQFDVRVSFDSRPVKGGWHGAGLHTKFSTTDTRDPNMGQKALLKVFNALTAGHHGDVTGGDGPTIELLGGESGTQSGESFVNGFTHRDAPIRIPWPDVRKGYIYLGGRHFGVDSDPYRIGFFLIATAVADGDGGRARRLLRETELLLTESCQDTNDMDGAKRSN